MSGTLFEIDALEVPPELLEFDVAPLSSLSGSLSAPPRLFLDSSYPTQFEDPDDRFHAELRGAYANDRWRPSSSRFGFTRNNGETFHSGVDIYAPVGTPLRALATGRAEMKAMTGSEKIGNRVWLTSSNEGTEYRLIYGHLERFEGRSGDVEAGDVIGYVGCSGNADYGRICSEPNKCGFSASHVHVIAYREDGKRVDVSRLFNIPLRYDDDQRDVSCEDL